MKYYQIVGKNKYISKFYYTKAENTSDAKINFYLNAGDTINYIIRITKEAFLKNQ